MKVLRRISGAIFAVSLFFTYGTVGLADMGEWHPRRLIALFLVCVISCAVWIMSKEGEA